MHIKENFQKAMDTVSLPQRGRWIVEDETDEEVTNPQIARLLKTFSEGFDSSKK